jgi:hypothetical protein
MEDRLSALPDELLLQILMLLPLIQVVQTCVLSRRWRKFWTETEILHVVDREVDGGGVPGRFVRVVDSILSVYDRQPSRAHCNFQISVSREDNVDIARLTSWARSAAELFEGDFLLGVDTQRNEGSGSEEDELSEWSDSDSDQEPEIFELPYFEFARKITITLNASFLFLALPLEAGAFKALSELVLTKLSFVDGGDAALSDVVSSCCPRLVSLVMRFVHGVTALTLRANSLRHLTLSCVHGLRLLDVVAPELGTMAVHSCFVASERAVLRLFAPWLLRFEWADCCPEHTEVGPTDHLNTLLVGELRPVTWDQGFLAHSNFDMILRHFRRTQLLELRLLIRPVSTKYFTRLDHMPNIAYIYLYIFFFFKKNVGRNPSLCNKIYSLASYC